MVRSLAHWLIILGLLGLLIALGSQLRTSLGIEVSPESVRTFAEGLGPLAPVLFVGIVALRGFFLLPSQVVLIAAGLCFGTFVGAVVGGTGLMLSGLALFTGARLAGREAVERRLGKRFQGALAASQGKGAAVAIALGSGYPISPLSPIHAVAGLSLISVPLFIAGALTGGVIRASIFSYFGNAILEDGLQSVLLAGVGLGAVLVLPLCFPRGRRWLARLFGRPA